MSIAHAVKYLADRPQSTAWYMCADMREILTNGISWVRRAGDMPAVCPTLRNPKALKMAVTLIVVQPDL